MLRCLMIQANDAGHVSLLSGGTYERDQLGASAYIVLLDTISATFDTLLRWKH